jgi:hypothetical protein
MTVAAEPDPYYALPKLRGGPAYARPPRVAPESERPFDPDDLPIAAEQAADEGTFTGMLSPSTSATGVGSAGEPGVGASRFSLRALTDRLGPRPK